ncbi:3-hydroxyacyl-CoA dehydrogenase NAD-binding domain-containing protein [Paraphotobacterium marinum]
MLHYNTENKIGFLKIDALDQKVNIINALFLSQLNNVIDEIIHNNSLKGLIIYSGKKNSFIAGADINLISSCTNKEAAKKLAQELQGAFNRLEKLKVITVCYIEGSCLGGGLEFALSCDYRVCSSKASLGFPEIQLGILPGAGGTQRLPRLVGAKESYKMILKGNSINAKQAKKIGLIDSISDDSDLLSCKNIVNNQCKKKIKWNKWFYENNIIIRRIIKKRVLSTIPPSQLKNYPAISECIDCIHRGLGYYNLDKGLELEAIAFGKLAISAQAKALINIFFQLNEYKKKITKQYPSSMNCNKLSVLGGGLMGGGISFVSIYHAKTQVVLKDISIDGILAAYKSNYNLLKKKLKFNKKKNIDLKRYMSQLNGTLDYKKVHGSNIVIEAVYEDLTLKQKMVTDIENLKIKDLVYASNTSSIPISKIAENSKNPENILGIHYFSPVEKMKLVEIIPQSKTSSYSICKAINLVFSQKKIPIIVADKPGFFINRILIPYLMEATYLLDEGYDIEMIDKALVDFGFPVGPFTLIDNVGIDIANDIFPVMQKEYGTAKYKSNHILTKLLMEGYKGKKNKLGFYKYKGNSKVFSNQIYELLDIKLKPNLSQSVIIERCLYILLNEAGQCIHEEIIDHACEGDIASVFGIGFPAYKGGPFYFMDKLGLEIIESKLLNLEKAFGKRFKPYPIIQNMSEKKLSFYS